MRSTTLRITAAGMAGGLIVLTGGPAAAAGGPNDHAPCLAQVFQAQAVSGPRTVSSRILEIREDLLGDDAFGQVLKPLTRFSC